jgi:Dolichyl-phosphate-mannose-protein mannosyltransferase
MRTSEHGTLEIDKFSSRSEEEQVPTRYSGASYIFMCLLVAYVILHGIVAALARPFWYDELFTLTVANQPTLHDMWYAVKAGFDSAPPGFYFVERMALGLPVKKELALRLPSILAFACVLLCVFVYTKKRSDELVGCLCASLLLSTLLFQVYSVEARAYSMVAACITFAIVCYHRLPGVMWAILLGLTLAIAESLHYYAIFAMVPFWVAEGAFLLTTRRFRWHVWLALVFGTLPLIAFWPLLMTYKVAYGPNTFARPIFSAVPGYYATFFLLSETSVGIALAVVAVAGITWTVLRRDRRDRESPNDHSTLAEGALLATMVALPFIIFALVVPMHGILLNRYALPATIGVAVGLVSAVALAGRKAAAFFALFLLCIVGMRQSYSWLHPDFHPFMPYFSASSAGELQRMKRVIEAAGHTDLPIVVSDCLLHSQFVYYFEPGLTKRLVYLADEQREPGGASRTQLAFSKFFPLRVEDYSMFTAAHPEFLLYSEGIDWYLPILEREGASKKLVSDGYGRVYLIRMNNPPATEGY